jgi:adenylate kinase family enzyme
VASFGHDREVRRIVILGPGASGKSTLARALADATGLPLVELDTVFWSSGLAPTPRERWIEVQRDLAAADAWILDGDLGPYDALDVRLRRADTVVLLDLPTWRCALRAVRRSRERLDFWRWLLTWRRRYRPELLRAVGEHAPRAEVVVIRDRRGLERLLRSVGGCRARRGSAGRR